MSEYYPPEQQALEQAEAARAAEQQAMDARVAQAEPAKPEAAVSAQQATDAGVASNAGDASEMQAQVADRSYNPAVEADNKVAQAKDTGMEARPLEAKNFEKSGVMSDEEVQTYLEDNLPEEHIRAGRIHEIRYEDRFREEDGGYVLGECIPVEAGRQVSEIELYHQAPDGSYSRDEMEHTLVHEVGHNVYWNLSEADRGQWNALSGSGRADNYVSDYAMTNTREDFAESYAYYVRDPVVLQDASMPKYNFMRDKVFSGRQYG